MSDTAMREEHVDIEALSKTLSSPYAIGVSLRTEWRGHLRYGNLSVWKKRGMVEDDKRHED